MASLTSVNLIEVHWSYWCATTCWLACYDMCLRYFQLDSIIHCTLTSFRTQLSQLGFLSVVNLSVHYGLHSVKPDSLIQFEWHPWEFELSWNSWIWHDHFIVSSFFHLIIQSYYFHCSTIFPILCIFVCVLCETMFSVLRPLWQINMVSELMVGQSSYSQKQVFW